MIVFYGIDREQKQYLQTAHAGLPIRFATGAVHEDALPPKNTRVLSIHTKSRITKGVLAGLPELELIITRTTGTDHIDLVNCRNSGVRVANLAGQNAVSVAEFTWGLILAANRKIIPGSSTVKPGQFHDKGFYGTELAGKKLGVLGTGAIGSHVLHIAKAFGMELYGNDFRKNKTLARKLGMRYVSVKQLFKNSDIISLHIPATPMTKKLVNRSLLKLMRPGAGLVNTARGAVVDSAAVLAFLQSGKLAWYAADVLDREHAFIKPSTAGLTKVQKNMRQINRKLVAHNNTIITPHMAHATEDADQRILEETALMVKKYMQGKKIKYVI